MRRSLLGMVVPVLLLGYAGSFSELSSEESNQQARNLVWASMEAMGCRARSKGLRQGPFPPPSQTMNPTCLFSDGNVFVEVYSITNPHVDELQLVYLPEDKALYVADAFTRDLRKVRPATDEENWLAEELEKLKLDVKVLLPGHGPVSSMQDLRRSLELGRHK